MLDDDELMYTRILNHNATPNEITNYIDKLHKEIKELKQSQYNYNVSNEYISKQKIKDKIYEIITGSKYFNVLSPLNRNEEYYATRFAVDILHELLEGENK